MRTPESNVARAVAATCWSYSGRVVGLGWMALLLSKLGFADYGTYAIGIAGAAIINAAIDNAFLVRSLRVDDDRFQRERCARVLFGTVVAAAGVVLFPVSAVAGFAVVVAAGELLFNTFKSQYMRAGRPDTALRFDAIRQVASIAVAAGYLVLTSDPQLSTALALYTLPYAVILSVCLGYVPGRRPGWPGSPREIGLLTSEALAAAVYAQGDILVLGVVLGEEVTGYYSLALVTALAVSTVGQHYASTFIETLRRAGGALAAAPQLSNVLRAAWWSGCAMAGLGVAVLIWGGANEVGYLIVILSVWVAAKTVQFNFIVILFAQQRDALRARATAVTAVLKVAALFPVATFFGVYGAAVVAVCCEIALTAAYHHVLFRRGVVQTGGAS